MLENLAIVAGVIMGSFYDILFLGMLVLAASVAFSTHPFNYIYIAVASVISGFIRVFISSSNRAALGLPESPIANHILAGTVVSMVVVFGLVLFLRRVFSMIQNSPVSR